MPRTSDQISDIMRRVKSVGTKPELFFKTLLESKLATSTHDDPERRLKLPGKPDFYFLPQNLAVFIDGDFWHGRQWWKRGFASLEEHLLPRANSAYWIKKIRSNLARDRKVTRSLLNQGVHVLRFWESDLKQNPNQCLKLTLRALKAATDGSRQRKPDAIRRRALLVEETNLRTVDLSPGKWGSLSNPSLPQVGSNIPFSIISSVVKPSHRPCAAGTNQSDLNDALPKSISSNFRWTMFKWPPRLSEEPTYLTGLGIHHRFFRKSPWSTPDTEGLRFQDRFFPSANGVADFNQEFHPTDDFPIQSKSDSSFSKFPENLTRECSELSSLVKERWRSWIWKYYVEPILTENLRSRVYWSLSGVG